MRRLIRIATVSLLGLFVVPALFAGSGVAQGIDWRDIDIPENWSFAARIGLSDLSWDESAIERGEVTDTYSHAIAFLKGGDVRRFLDHLVHLRFLAAHAAADRNRKLAQYYLKRLPKKFIPHVAIVHEDGTLARDPDPFIRLWLIRDKDVLEGNSDQSNR